ncbi:MAG: hypothetical protein U0905_03790 [Pirellulales bacterium]
MSHPAHANLRRIVVFALVVIAVVRLSISIASSRSLDADPDAYQALAVSWDQSGTFGLVQSDGKVHPTAFRPPLYPWFLSWCIVDGRVSHAAIIAFHTFLAIVTSAVTIAIGYRLFPHKPHWAIAAGCIAAIDPILLRQSTLIMTETLATTMTMVLWWQWIALIESAETNSRWNRSLQLLSLVFGGSLGLAALCRPTGLLWGATLLLGLRWRPPSQQVAVWRWVFLGLLCVMVPWMVRNQSALGKPILMTTHGGYTLYLANNDFLYQHFRENGPERDWDATAFHEEWSYRRPATEINDDRLAQVLATQTIRQQPGMFVTSIFIRWGWLWALWPSEGSWPVRLAIGIWYAGWYAAAIFGVLLAWRSGFWKQKGWKIAMPALLFVATLTLIHGVYWSNMRMRAPAMPILYLAGTSGCSALLQRRRDSRILHPQE